MTPSYFEICVTFKSVATDEQFEDFIESVVGELEDIGRKVDVTGFGDRREALFLGAAPDLSDESLIGLLSDLRSALHGANCGTPDWPTAHEITSTRAVPSREMVPA